MFRRVRSVLIRPLGLGLAASTLHFDYEVRAAKEAFAEVPNVTIKGEMLELAEHIIKTKLGEFDPRSFHDRYEAALAELVKAKIEGRTIEKPKAPKPVPATDLMAALRESAALAGKPRAPSKSAGEPKRATTARAAPRKKAG